MQSEQISLARQMDLVIRTMQDELRYLASGTVFVQIRNDVVGKYGVKHEPIEISGEEMPAPEIHMSDSHIKAFRQLAVGSLSHKRNWTYGEIYFEFAMRRNVLNVSIQLESNYNMANLFNKFPPQ